MTQPLTDARVASAATKADLVERARAGDHSAFAILAKGAFGRMYGAAKLILRDQHRAEDAVQDALLLAWRRISTIRDPDAWDAWLYRLTVRACYRLAQAPAGRALHELDVRMEPAGPAPDFTTAVVEHDRVMAALSVLPMEQRAVIVLHFYLDLSLVQAAAVLDVPAGTAKSRLHRGLEALRVSLGDDPERAAAALRRRPV